MAYDAATGTIVLFGGNNANSPPVGDTWTWDGSTWTKQAPATSPSAREVASMAYDAATGTIVLFGGVGLIGKKFRDFGGHLDLGRLDLDQAASGDQPGRNRVGRIDGL